MKSEDDSSFPQNKKRCSGTFRNLVACMLMASAAGYAQQMYDNHDDITEVNYITRPEGRVEAFSANPSPGGINTSARCAKFRRNRLPYDYVKIRPANKLENADAYASYDEAAPKLRMKILTDAPVGTVVEIQLGREADNAYPEGTHSQYRAVTGKSGEWEQLEFTFAVIPKGSRTSAKQIDQITLLFMPGTSKIYTFYFDDLEGPEIAETRSAKLFRKR